MGRSHRHEKEWVEGTMPERPPLTPTPDFPPRVVTEMDPINVPSLYRTPYLLGPARYMHIRVELHRQTVCRHDWGVASRFGDAECALCGARAWSKWWVAEGIYGLASALDPDALDGTGSWLEKEAQDWERRAMQPVDPGHHVTSRLTATVLGTIEVDDSDGLNDE